MGQDGYNRMGRFVPYSAVSLPYYSKAHFVVDLPTTYLILGNYIKKGNLSYLGELYKKGQLGIKPPPARMQHISSTPPLLFEREGPPALFERMGLGHFLV